MNNGLFTVMAFTMRNKFRSKSFLITSLIIAVLISVVINLPYIISLFKSDQPTDVGVFKDSSGIPQKMEQFYAAQEEPGIHIIIYDDQGSKEANDTFMKEKIANKEIKGYLQFEPNSSAVFPKVIYKSEASMEYGTSGKLQAALQSIKTEMVAKDLLTPQQLSDILSPVSIQNMQITTKDGGAGTVGSGKTESQIAAASVMVYALIILLFMGVMITGQLIATEITAEKSSRVMEVLVTSVSPLKQMFGKIIGMLMVGLSQILILGAVAGANLSMPHNIKAIQNLDINFSDIPLSMYVYAILFYFMGYFLYATLYAAVGSIVSRTEDLGQAVMPITFLSLGGFYIAIFGLTNPNAPFVEITSFIPFFTPFIMFLRIGTTDPAAWEVLLSIGILAATIFFFGWLSAKIYRTGVLMYGKRPSFKELRKAMKAYKV